MIETNLSAKSNQTLQAVQSDTRISKEAQIEQLKSHLKAIEEKKNWILQDPVRIQEANQSGWFDQMKETTELLTQQIKDLTEIKSEHP